MMGKNENVTILGLAFQILYMYVGDPDGGKLVSKM